MSEQDIGKIVETLSTIYHEFDNSDFLPHSFEDHLKQRNFSNSEIKELKPLLTTLYNSKNQTFFNDSWTDNWLLQGDNVVLLDTEDWGKASLGLDLAFFLNCIPQGTLEKRLEIVENIGNSLPKGNNLIEEYLAAAVYTSLVKSPSIMKRGKKSAALSMKSSAQETLNFMEKENMISKDQNKLYTSYLLSIFSNE